MPKVDLEALKQESTLTEDQSAAIALEVLEEEEAAKGKKPGEPSDEEPKDTEKADAEGAGKAEGEEGEGAKKPAEEEPSKEDKDRKAKEEEDARKKAEEDFSKEIEGYAKEHNISVEDAKEEFEQSKKIGEKYANDPKKLAMANLHLQRLFSAKEEELKSIKNAPAPVQAPTSETILKLIEDGKLTLDGKTISKQEAIDAFRKENADITESADDEVVLKLMVKDIQNGLISRAKEDATKVVSLAKEKREKLLSSLPEQDKRFTADVKAVLDKVADAAVVNDGFSMEPYILYAKGKVYDKEIKEAEEKGYKRGKEEAQIIAKRPEAGVGAGAGGKKDEKGAKGLTDRQKEEALEHFANFSDITDEKKFEMYKEILDDEAKRKSGGK